MNFKQYKSKANAIQSLKSDHFSCEFEFEEEQLCCKDSGNCYRPSELYLVEYHRFDQENQVAMVYAILCNDGNKGLLQFTYNSKIDMNIITFLDKVKIVTEEMV